jgi:regulator of RNase E activity RraA
MKAWETLSSSLASDATGGEGVLPAFVRALYPGQRLVGRATVARVAVDDNGAIRDILDRGERHDGQVLVVSGSWASTSSVTGGITVVALRRLGFAGLVTDGLVRDSAEIRDSGLLVWCRGTSPIAPRRRESLEQSAEIAFGRVLVRSNDLIIADDDGIVVWADADLPYLTGASAAKEHSDAERLARILKD